MADMRQGPTHAKSGTAIVGAARPKISVIITCYNYADYVGTAIDSVLSQSVAPEEIIVVDDGSSDFSWEIIESYGAQIKAYRIRNQGSVKACLYGIAASQGEFIQFLDADDYLAQGAIAKIREQCRTGVSKIQFPLIPVNSTGAPIGEPNPPGLGAKDSRELIAQINTQGSYETPPTSGNVFNRKIFDYIGDLAYERGIDGVTYLIAPFIGTVATIEEPLAFYRVHDRNKSNFAALSASHLDAEADRFVARLRHLAEICQTQRFEGLDIAAKLHGPAEFSYVLEKRILSGIASSRRPSVTELVRYVCAVRAERYSALRTILVASWASGLAVLPNRYLHKLAILRSNPWARRPVWSWVKRKSSARRLLGGVPAREGI